MQHLHSNVSPPVIKFEKTSKSGHGSSINARDITGRRSTPLHFAAGFGRKDVVEYLLSIGGDVASSDEGGLIPLHNACSFGHSEVVRLLIEAGSNVNTSDKWGYSPLHEAAIKGKADVCIGLLQSGANHNSKNTDGKTPLELAEGSARQVRVSLEMKRSMHFDPHEKVDQNADPIVND